MIKDAICPKASLLNSDCLIVGGGRMATQFAAYLEDLGLSFDSWQRSQTISSLKESCSKVKRILLLVPDKAISPLVDEHWELFREKILIHFSATHRDPRVLAFHPLGSFARSPKINFHKVHFHGPHPESLFRETLPFLPNTYRQLGEKEMQLYHALCVLGANYTSLLWKSFFIEMKKLGVAEEALKTFCEMSCQNLMQNPLGALTGPLVREDVPTLEKNILALEGHKELKEIYTSFVNSFLGSEYLKA